MRPRRQVLSAGRVRRRGWRRALVGSVFGVAVLALTLSVCSSSPSTTAQTQTQGKRVTGGPTGHYLVASGIHKIKHVIVIEQENRSFDSYFGTYPGADGIPMQNGKPTVCVPNPTGGCTAPYHDTADVNGGGPHNVRNAAADVNNGAMDGFIKSAANAKKGCLNPTDPACTNSATPDVMGYHTAAEIPNYWTYAKDFVARRPHVRAGRTRGRSPTTSTWCRAGRPSARTRTRRAARTRSRVRTRRRRCRGTSTRRSRPAPPT